MLNLRRWGIVVTTVYLLALILIPAVAWMSGIESPGSLLAAMVGADNDRLALGVMLWLWILLLATSQALLLFVAVDRSERRLRPRATLIRSIVSVTIAVGLLVSAIVWAGLFAIWGDDALELAAALLLTPLTFWALWALVFYFCSQAFSARLDAHVAWLLRGSILELLVAVPCHVYVRQRGDCCAPFFRAWGIATGIAVMLLAFGPSVLFLYQKRLGSYRRVEL